MNKHADQPLSTHSAERVLYQVQIRLREGKRLGFTMNDRAVGYEWQELILPPRGYCLSEHWDTAAEIDDNLLPYPLAMKEAWDVLATEHAHAFEVRLVPHVVKTSYAAYALDALPELEREPK